MLSSETFLSSQFWHVFQWKSKKVIVAKSARINVLNNSVEVITIFFLYEPILHGRQLGDYFPNQVASSKILGANGRNLKGCAAMRTLGLYACEKLNKHS